MESMNRDDQMQWLMKRFSQRSGDEMSNEMKSKMTPEMLRCMNTCGILYFLTVSCIIVLTSYCLTLPSIFSDNDYWTRAVFGVIVVIQVRQVKVKSIL